MKIPNIALSRVDWILANLYSAYTTPLIFILKNRACGPIKIQHFFFKSKNFLEILRFFLTCPSILAFARARIVHARVYIFVPALRGHVCEATEVLILLHGICHSIQCICHYFVLPKLFCFALKCANLCTKYMLFAGLLEDCFAGAVWFRKNSGNKGNCVKQWNE